MNKLPDGQYLLNRSFTDQKLLEEVKVSPPMPERKPAYYRILQKGQMYHVFNAERTVS